MTSVFIFGLLIALMLASLAGDFRSLLLSGSRSGSRWAVQTLYRVELVLGERCE